MANFVLTRWTGTITNDINAAMAELETQLETVNNAKVIRLCGVAEVGPGKYFQAYALYDT